jgi:serine/threonine-protein kinase
MLMGTPCYMSPEQADGLTTEVDHVSDVFALGTIAYVCLTGAQPFDGPSVPATLYNVCHLRPRPARELLPALPAAVDAVLERAMAKRKVDRYQDVAEFVDDLRRALAGLPLRRLPQEERTQPVERVGEGLARARTAPSRRAEGAAAEEARTPRLEALQAIPTGPQTPRIEPATPPLEPGGNGRRGHPEPTTPPFEAESPREDSPLPEMIPDEDFTRERSQAAPPRSAHLRAIVIAVGLLVAAGAATAAYFVADPGGPTTAAPIAASERVLASPAPDAGRPGALDLARHESPPPDVSVVDLRPPVAEGDDDDDSQAGRRTSSRVKRTKQTKGTKPVKPGRQKKTPSAGEPQPQPKAKPAVPADDLYTDP